MITSKAKKRVELEHEPGEWVDVRMPSYAMIQEFRSGEGGADWQALFSRCIQAWSYEDPVTPENIAELDSDTVMAITTGLLNLQTPEAQKKDSAPSTAP